MLVRCLCFLVFVLPFSSSVVANFLALLFFFFDTWTPYFTRWQSRNFQLCAKDFLKGHCYISAAVVVVISYTPAALTFLLFSCFITFAYACHDLNCCVIRCVA